MRTGMKKILLLLATAYFFSLFGCGGCGKKSTTPEEDIPVLEKSCQIANDACSRRCNNNVDCERACKSGLKGCIQNLHEDRPANWQPADSFFDSCTTQALDEFGHSACELGQSAASCDSKNILRKYGTISQCP